MLAVDGLVVRYGAVEALHGISFTVASGEVVALIGANGAGKTSTLAAISGLVRARGSVRLEGRELVGRPAHEIVRAGVAQVPEGRQIFARMSVEENLRLGGIARRARDGWKQTLEQVYALFPVLPQRRRQLAGTLSGGEQQMLAIGRGLMARPRLMLLDEPTLGLAPVMAAQIFELLRKLAHGGLTLLLAEQDVNRTLAVANYGYVIENGRVVRHDRADTLLHDPNVREAYLGAVVGTAGTIVPPTVGEAGGAA
jgi:branched-chain amino acid transport system ATP-binding protein